MLTPFDSFQASKVISREDFTELQILLNTAKGAFWVFALYNSVEAREAVIAEIKRTAAPKPVIEWTYSPESPYPLAYQNQLTEEQRRQPAVVFFLDQERGDDKAWKSLDYNREDFAELPHGLIFWVTTKGRVDAALKAPHFWAQRTSVFDFTITHPQRQLDLAEAWAGRGVSVSDYNDALRQLRIYQGLFDEYSALSEAPPASVADVASKTADLLINLSRYDEAIPYLQRQLEIAQSLNDRAKEALAWHQLATIDLYKADYEMAREKFNRALQIRQQIGDRAAEAATLHQLATINLYEGNYPAAKELFQYALSTFQQIGNRTGEANTLHNLATIDLDEGNHSAARELFQRALTTRRQIGARAGEAGTLHQLAMIDFKEGNYPAARELTQLALSISQQIGHRVGVAQTLHLLASIDLVEGNYQAARELFQRTLTTRQQIGDRAGEAATFYQIGAMAHRQGKLAPALRLLALSLGLSQAIGHKHARFAAENLEVVAKQLNFTPEQIEALKAEVLQEYERDRGVGLVRAAFGEE